MVSIIVPVYNGETYLNRCVKSILAQSYTDLELILVDDGSRDATPRLCDSWAEKDSRVRVIHQQNAGVSAARNAGLDAACGDYIGFVDADDWVDEQMLKEAMNSAQLWRADIVIFDPYIHKEGKKQIYIDSIPCWQESAIVRKEDITPEQLRFIAGAIWRCLYCRKIINENNIRYITSLPLSEDRLFNMTFLGCSKTVYYLRKPFYHYWVNSLSATGKYRTDLLEIVLNTQKKTEQVLLRYWNEAYIPIYERVNVVDGALLCVYNACSPKSSMSLKRRYLQIKEVVHHNNICAVYSKLKKPTIRQWLVKRKCALALCLVGIAWNIKNK